MPGSDEKPFKCSTDGCGQTFTNEDHLTVHRLKHQMSLTLSPGGNKFHFPDQTPTPTKFLRYGEEIGLFTDIKNPFDDAFKSAAESIQKTGKVSTPLAEGMQLSHGPEESDTLNTPTPHTYISQHDTPLKKRYRPSHLAAVTPSNPPPPLPGPQGNIEEICIEPDDLQSDASLKMEAREEMSPVSPSQYTDTQYTSAPSSQESQLLQDEDVPEYPLMAKPSLRSPQASLNAQQLAASALSQPHTQQLPSPKLQASESLPDTKPLLNIAPKRPHSLAFSTSHTPIQTRVDGAKPVTGWNPTSITVVPSPGQSLQSASITSTDASQYMIQMMVQTADGKYVPVNIPALPATNTSPAKSLTETIQPVVQPVLQSTLQVLQPAPTTQGTINKTVPVVVGNAAATSKISLATAVTANSSGGSAGNASLTTKQRLKAAIQQNSPLGHKAFSSLSSPPGTRGSSTSDSNPTTPQGGVQYQDADSSGNRDLDGSEGLNDDDCEKRKRFLERNRAAAYRCRAKKREWQKNLEKKAEDLQAVNTRLQNEVTQLRAEMTKLKELLLAHKDCPITIQQRQSGQLSLQRVKDTSEMSLVLPNPRPLVSSAHGGGGTDSTRVKLNSSLVSIKPAHKSSPQGVSQIAKVPTGTYRIHNDPGSSGTNRVIIGQPVSQIGQIGLGQAAIGQGQVIAVDLSKLSTVQLNTVSKS